MRAQIASAGMPDAYIVDAVRTPVGRYAGALSSVRPDDLAARVIAAAVERTGLPGGEVEDVFFGCTNDAGEDNRNVARMALLIGGLPQEVPGVTVNRLCALRPRGGEPGARARSWPATATWRSRGGVESMTRSPFVMLEARARLPARRHEPGGHHAGLALREPAHGGALLDRLDGRDRRERRRALRRVARGPGRVRARVAQARGGRRRGRPLRRRARDGRRSAAQGPPGDRPLRRGPAPRHHAREPRQAAARCSARAAP